MLGHVDALNPAELYLLFQQSGLLDTMGKSRDLVKSLTTGRFPVEELQKFVDGEPSLVDDFTSGARSVRAAVAHPVLSGAGIERLNRSKISEVIVTDTIPLPAEKQIDKITTVSVAPLLAAAIHNINRGESVSSLTTHNGHVP